MTEEEYHIIDYLNGDCGDDKKAYCPECEQFATFIYDSEESYDSWYRWFNCGECGAYYEVGDEDLIKYNEERLGIRRGPL